MFRKYRLKNYDFLLVIMVIALNLIGILAIGSAKESVQDKQIMGMALGLILMIALSLFDYSLLLRANWIFYILNMILLTLVIVMGDEAGGAQRWIDLKFIRFQPSETAKIFLILFFAQFIMKYRDQLNTIKILAASVAFFLPPWLLIYKQPDLSTSIMVLVLFAVILFIGGLSYKIVGGVFAVVIPLTVIFFSIVLQPDQTLIEPYQQTRILAWLHPEEYSNSQGYQQANSMMAIGSGMLTGKGLNNNVIASVKNGNFIPEPQTDFIFAVIGEEMGFIGAAACIVLAFVIALQCVMAAKHAKDMAGMIICAGVATMIGCQSFLNISVATGLMPNTGIPLPFVSYGLTSLLSSYMGIGLVLNVRLQGKNNGRERV